MRAVIGDAQASYLHDMVFKWPLIGELIGMLLRGSMEGFEHANKLAGAILTNQTSQGGRLGANGLRKDEFMQLLELRRAGTVAAQETGRVNMFSRAEQYTLPAAMYERKISVTDALVALKDLRKEFDARPVDCDECTE